MDSGLIPAYAGKTGRSQPHGYQSRAHPRVCGENASSRPSHERSAGSSPRMRGKPRAAASARWGVGLIPAYAGKTPMTPSSRPWPRAHPRVCGENRRRARCRLPPEGSSPRMRGKPWRGAARHRWPGSSPRMRGKPYRENAERATYGLIPAYAGKTLCETCLLCLFGAHPRVCGEN